MELRNNTIKPILALFTNTTRYRVFWSDFEAANFFGVSRRTIRKHAQVNKDVFTKKSRGGVVLRYIGHNEAELISCD